MEENGLKINNQIIKKISGPVSFNLLVPNGENKKFFNNSKIQPPIIILFGDIHFDMSNLCQKCEKEYKCYNIWSKNLLDLLDNMAKKIKIDFNLEQGFGVNTFQNYGEDSPNGPLSILTTNILPCFFKRSNCPTKNIRWNYVDTRYVKEDNKYNFEALFTQVENFFHNVQPNIDTLKINNLDQYFYIIVSDLINYNFNTPDYTFSQNNFLEILKIIFNILKSGSYEDFFKNDKITRSLIYKQIKKLPPPLNNIEFWKDKMDEYIKYVLYKRFTLEDIINTLEFLKYYIYLLEDIEDLISEFNQKNIKITNDLIIREIFNTEGYDSDKKLKLISPILNLAGHNTITVLLYFNSIFLDMYYVLRTLKLPVNISTKKYEENSVLSICYFGVIHVIHITYFLTNILKIYNNDYVIEQSKDNRCIDFTSQKINLDKLIVKHFI